MQTSQKQWKKSLPMLLTWSRIAICPIIVALIMIGDKSGGDIWSWLAAGLFIMASITDWLDGYYARKFQATSTMGKLMDPIADKILVASALITLIPTDRVSSLLVLLLLARDILIGGIRAVAAADKVIIDAKATGKWKTGFQMVAIPAILIGAPILGLPTLLIGSTLLWTSVILSLVSGVQYIRIYNQSRRQNESPS